MCLANLSSDFPQKVRYLKRGMEWAPPLISPKYRRALYGVHHASCSLLNVGCLPTQLKYLERMLSPRGKKSPEDVFSSPWRLWLCCCHSCLKVRSRSRKSCGRCLAGLCQPRQGPSERPLPPSGRRRVLATWWSSRLHWQRCLVLIASY